MDFSLTHEQRLLIDTVRQFISAELAPLEQQVEEHDALLQVDAERIFARSRELGLYAMNMPVEFGGGGLSTFDWILVEEQFGVTSDILVRRAFGNVYDLLLHATPAQRERWLLPAVAGERTFSIAFTEPEAGSDAAAVRTRAIANGDGWVLNGYKHYISDARYSDFFIVTAVTDPAAAHRGISTFIVDKDSAGFTVGPNQPMMGLRGTTHAALTLHDVRLGAEHLLGAPGQGLKLALTTLSRVRLAQVCARAVGKATHLLNLTLEHCRQRRQFDQPIGNFQMVQQQLADCAMSINSARLTLWQAAWLLDQGLDARAQISAVKIQAAEALGRVADTAVQLFGGAGFSKELPIERYYRDARIYRIFDGTSEIHRGVLAKELLRGDGAYFNVAT